MSETKKIKEVLEQKNAQARKSFYGETATCEKCNVGLISFFDIDDLNTIEEVLNWKQDHDLCYHDRKEVA